MMAAELEIKCSLNVEKAAKHLHHVLLATGSREQCGHHGLVVAPACHHQPLPLSAPDCGAEDDWKKLLRRAESNDRYPYTMQTNYHSITSS